MPKLLLIQSSQYGLKTGLIRQKKLYLPGLVFPLLAAMLPDSWEVEIKLEVIDDVDFNTDADLVGIGAMGHAIFRAFDLAREFKKRGKTVFMGGFMASMIPEIVLEVADSVVIGDAEISFPKLISDFEKNARIERIYNNPVISLAGLPLPKYELLTEKKIGDMLPVQAGRGCNHQCSFCSIACLYKGRYMNRPVDEVVRDIEKIRSLGYRKFYIIDDNLVNSPEYLEELCKRISPLKMKWSSQCTMNLARNPDLLKLAASSGCEILSLGIESISQEGLEKMNKKWLRVDDHEKLIRAFNKAGIMISAEMIIGTDSDTVESLRETWDFIRRTKLPLVRVYILTPVPATELYKELKAEGRLIHEDYAKYTSSQCVHYPAKISPEKLTGMYNWLNGRIFSLKGIMTRTVFSRLMITNPGNCIFAIAINLHYRSYVRKGETPLIV
jgi:radical SAM superfamily enzyme YgiQ (UPF0313 family)